MPEGLFAICFGVKGAILVRRMLELVDDLSRDADVIGSLN